MNCAFGAVQSKMIANAKQCAIRDCLSEGEVSGSLTLAGERGTGKDACAT